MRCHSAASHFRSVVENPAPPVGPFPRLGQILRAFGVVTVHDEPHVDADLVADIPQAQVGHIVQVVVSQPTLVVFLFRILF